MTTQENTQPEYSITHIWERFNLRWIATGAATGFTAGLVVLLVACVIAANTLGEWSQPLKILGAGCYGPQALAFGPIGIAGVYGFIFHSFLSTLYGATYAQLVDENSSARSFLILALVTSAIIWIFGGCLFAPTFNKTLTTIVSPVGRLYFHLLFGASFGILIPFFKKYLLKTV